MFFRSGTIVFVISLALGACATDKTQTVAEAQEDTIVAAAPVDTEGDVTTEVEEVDQDRIICRRKIITGSRFKKKICLTWREWQQSEQQASDFSESIQRKSGQLGNVDGG